MRRLAAVRRRPNTDDIPTPGARGDLLIAATGVSISYRGVDVLRGVDVAARAGELVALVGPNGAGKSSLLAVLAGDLSPTTGTVTLRGRDLSELTEGEAARRRAVLPQQHVVTFPFTVRQVVEMGRAPWLHTARSSDDDRAIDEALAATDVAHLTDRPVSSLSGGEAARVAMARVLAQETQVLLLDEPTAALDLHHQELCLEVVRARVGAGAAAVVVLHDLGAAAAHAHRVVVLAQGAVVADGPPDTVLTPELLGEVYAHAVDVVPHPVTGTTLVLPRRGVPR